MQFFGKKRYHIVTQRKRKWTEIYEWNRVTIGDDPSLIYEGMILNLPWETVN